MAHGTLLCRERRVVALGGLDAPPVRQADRRVVVRLMSYARSFASSPNVLCSEPPSGELEHDRGQVYEGLRGTLLHRGVRRGPGPALPSSRRTWPWAREARRPTHSARSHAATPAGCACCATGGRWPRARAPRSRTRSRSRGVPHRGGALVEGPRAHLDPVQPALPALSRPNGVSTPYAASRTMCTPHMASSLSFCEEVSMQPRHALLLRNLRLR